MDVPHISFDNQRITKMGFFTQNVFLSQNIALLYFYYICSTKLILMLDILEVLFKYTGVFILGAIANNNIRKKAIEFTPDEFAAHNRKLREELYECYKDIEDRDRDRNKINDSH